MRTRHFVVETDVSGEFYRDQTETAVALAEQSLQEASRQPMLGPRGGRYERTGVYSVTMRATDPLRDIIRFGLRFQGKYVRPDRKAERKRREWERRTAGRIR